MAASCEGRGLTGLRSRPPYNTGTAGNSQQPLCSGSSCLTEHISARDCCFHLVVAPGAVFSPLLPLHLSGFQRPNTGRWFCEWNHAYPPSLYDGNVEQSGNNGGWQSEVTVVGNGGIKRDKTKTFFSQLVGKTGFIQDGWWRPPHQSTHTLVLRLHTPTCTPLHLNNHIKDSTCSDTSDTQLYDEIMVSHDLHEFLQYHLNLKIWIWIKTKINHFWNKKCVKVQIIIIVYNLD